MRATIRILCFVAGLSAAPAGRAETLVLVGGGNLPDAAIARFLEWSGGTKARLLVISWGDGDPDAVDDLKKKLAAGKPAELTDWGMPPQSAAERTKFLDAVSNATGVFVAGGFQTIVMRGLADPSLTDALRKRYRAGACFGGTSAGTAIMSPTMITGDGDFTGIDGSKVRIAEGLGLLPADIIVDQHFVRRPRMYRLTGLVLKDPAKLGIGIDEGTALLVKDGRRAEVVGAGKVMILDGRDPTAAAGTAAVREKPDDKDVGTLLMHVLKAGRAFDLQTRTVVKPEPK